MKKYKESNKDYENYNDQMKNDLAKCQSHYQNTLKYNAHIQEELDRYLCEDEQVLTVFQKKRAFDLLPTR